jgi:hypothetical protein
MTERKAIIIGDGPAGLTAAYELLTRTDIVPVVYEASDMIGGISRTVDYKGNKIDIGGHRFFSKSEQVVRWWLNVLPLQGGVPRNAVAGGNGLGPDPDRVDSVMLWRWRQSRILYSGKLFDCPISPSLDTISKLGVGRNGMHRYNNSDHSMLSAMTAVDHIAQGATSKDEIWAVNPEGEYHEAVTRSQGENHKPAALKNPGPHEIREWSAGKDSSESLPEKSGKAS